MYYVKQLNDGRWYVLRTGNEEPLSCENGGYPTRGAARRILRLQLKARAEAQMKERIETKETGK